MNSLTFRILIFVVWFGCGPGVALGEDWGQWRGPTADGRSVASTPPLTWDATTNIRWKAELPGEGSSTPIIWGNKVFILAAIDTNRKADQPPEKHLTAQTKPPENIYQFVVICFDRTNGHEQWRTVCIEQVPHEGRHNTNTFASASPTTDGTYLYASFGSPGVFCLDFEGNVIWSQNLGEMRTRSAWGEATSPVLHNDSLLINWDHEDQSFLTLLDKASGQPRWKVNRDEVTSWATPLITEFNGQTQIIVNGTGRVRSYDFETGEELWSCGGQTVNAIPSPMRYKDDVICMSGYGGQVAYSIPLASHGDLTDQEDLVTWHVDSATPYVPSAVIAGDLLYFLRASSGVISCRDARSGDLVFGPERLPGIRNVYASPVAAGGRIYFVGRNGATTVIQEGRELKVLARNDLDDTIDASPAIVDDQIFMRSNHWLYCISEK